MKKYRIVIALIVVIIVFTGCGHVTSLSGKFINEQNSNEWIKFSGKSVATIHADDINITGTYLISDDVVMITIVTEDSTDSLLLAIEDKYTLRYNLVGVAFVKKTLWNYYWKKILLYGTIGCFILGIIEDIIKRKKTSDKKSTTDKKDMTTKEEIKSAAEGLDETIDD